MLSVIIVSWNVRELLGKCLASLQADLARAAVDGRIVVVDSASSDGTPGLVRDRFPAVELIACPENVGYVRGNNLGMERLGIGDWGLEIGDWRLVRPRRPQSPISNLQSPVPRYLWLLNPDTEILPGATKALLEFMERHPRCGLCGPRLLNPDGSLQHGAFAFPGLTQLLLETQRPLWRLRGTRLDGRYPPARYAAGDPFRIGHPLGAAMLARAEAVAQVGPLDPGYEMYAEEVDWAMRMARAGWERWCVPSAVVTHYGGASSGQASQRAERVKWRSRQRYYRKHYGPLRHWLALRLVPARFREKADDARAPG